MMAKRRKRRAVFGSAATEHIQNARQALWKAKGSAEKAAAEANANHCTYAFSDFADARFLAGVGAGHLKSLGKHKRNIPSSVVDALRLARRALEIHCIQARGPRKRLSHELLHNIAPYRGDEGDEG